MAGVVLPVSDTAQPPETHLKETQRGKKNPKTQRQTKWTQGTLEKALAKDQLEIR